MGRIEAVTGNPGFEVGHGPETTLGKVLTESPEGLFFRKGNSMPRLQASDTCRTCFCAGRFRWPARTSNLIDRLVQSGSDAVADQ